MQQLGLQFKRHVTDFIQQQRSPLRHFDILADILQYSTFDETELERERAVVLQEIGQAEDTPDDIIFDHLQAVAFPDQPLGRPILGSPETVRRLSRDCVSAYLRSRYGASSMLLVGAGAIDHDHLVLWPKNSSPPCRPEQI